MCGSACKAVCGIAMVLIGLWLILPASICGLTGFWSCKSLWRELWEIIKGVVPISLIGLGALIVWVEAEELKSAKPKRRK